MIFPNRSKVIDTIRGLRSELFPNHYGPKKLSLEYLKKTMQEQIEIALLEEKRGAEASNITDAFFSSFEYIKEKLFLDAKAGFDGDPAAYSIDEVILTYPGFYAIYIYRLAHELHKQRIPFIPRILTEYAHSRTGIDIHPGAKIGDSFFIDHGTGVVIGETCVIGSNVKIYQGVTLGALSTKGGQRLKNEQRHPTIADNVTIYAGATILGGNTVIGSEAIIGGNAFVTESVKPGEKFLMNNCP